MAITRIESCACYLMWDDQSTPYSKQTSKHFDATRNLLKFYLNYLNLMIGYLEIAHSQTMNACAVTPHRINKEDQLRATRLS